jgi:membrane protein YdbS with pleckstrin-like domain
MLPITLSISGTHMELYIHKNGEQLGPYSEDQVRSYLIDETLHSSDLAWYDGAPDWAPLSSISTFARRTPPPLPRLTPAARLSRVARPVDLPEISPDSLGSYARSTLQSNETALYKTSVHWIIFIGGGIVAFMLLVFFALPMAIAIQAGSNSAAGWLVLILPVFIMLPAVVTYLTSELVITDKRILIKVGFIQRRTLEMFISKIESVGVNQGLVGRLLDYGTVTIRGTGGSVEPFRKIAHPLEFRNCVQRIQSHSDIH